VNGPRNLVLAVMFVILLTCFSGASDVYFAQSAAGGGSGTSCATAESVATFNGGSQVAGNTYHLCGTVTTPVTPSSSGKSGSPIMLLFDSASGGNISMPAAPSTGAINLSGRSYWIVDGGTPCGPGTTCSANQTGTGTIQNLCEGSPGSSFPGCGTVSQQSTGGIFLGYSGGCGSNIEIRNLLILNIYQRTSTSDDDQTQGAWYSGAVTGEGCGANMLVHDLTATWGHALIDLSAGAGANNYRVYNNYLANFAWPIYMNSTATIATNGMIYNNEVVINSAWGSWPQSTNFHVDGIFFVGVDATESWNGGYIYNNYIHGDWGTINGNVLCGTGFIYANQNLQNLYIFNNVFYITNGGYACNGLIATGYGTVSQYMLNNTFVGTSTASGGAWAMGDAGANAANSTTAENNIVSTMVGGWLYQDDSASAIKLIDYNDWYNLSGNGQSSAWQVGSLSPWPFIPWQACVACVASGTPDAHGTTGNPLLTGTFHLGASSSAAWQKGANLASMCTGQPNPGLGALCYDKNGVARPDSGAGPWDMGAYEDSASTAPAPAPPTGLAAVVQ